MSAKSFRTTNSGQCRRSGEQPGRNIDHTVKDGRSEGSKTSSKRKSEESLERTSKRSRTSQSPSNSGSQTFSGPSTSSLVTGCKKTSSKRKSTEDGREESPSKRSRTSHSPSNSGSRPFSGPSTSSLVTGCKKTSSKRKSVEDESEESPRKRSKGTPSPSEGPSHQSTSEASSSNGPGTSSSLYIDPSCSIADFEAKYEEEEEQLGRGGYGTVFAGRRKHDNLPVAIKHILQRNIEYTSMRLGGKIRKVPMEVALLLKLKPVAAVVTLLDWYSLQHELILVLERPVPCMDLFNYTAYRESLSLQEHEAQAITKQLVNALIEVHSRGVFHRDIKPENILLETSSDVPRVCLIDFGCGTYLSCKKFTEEKGTYHYVAPEWFKYRWYKAESTTVWQLGVVLYEMLHEYIPFCNSGEIKTVDPNVREGLSSNCNSFLQCCLKKRPESRPTLKKLQKHPWLK